MNTSTKVQQNFENIQLELDPNKVLFTTNNEGVIVYEEFRDIPEYEEMYQISSFGRVKSLKRKKIAIRKLGYRDRYFEVSIWKNNKGITITIHKLVAIVFLNHTPYGSNLVVDHKDNNPLNNNIENLQVITQRENIIKDREPRGIYGNTTKRNKKYEANLWNKGKNIYLGVFDTVEEASLYIKNAIKSIENNTKIIIKRPITTSKYKGVSWYKPTNKWASFIRRNNKTKHLGYYYSEEEAHLAYVLAEKNYSKQNNQPKQF